MAPKITQRRWLRIAESYSAGDPAQEPEQAVEDGQGVRRAAGDEEVNGHGGSGAIVNLGMADVGAAGNGAGADGDDKLRRGHGVVGLSQGEHHVAADGAGDEQAVGVAGRGDDLDAESTEVERRWCRGR